MSDKRKYTITLDDDRMTAKLIEQATGIKNLCFVDAASLLEKMKELDPLAVFVDMHLGEENGLDLIPRLRQHWFECPILVVTSDSDDQAVVQALTRGADDFVMKPLRAGELRARLQVRLADRAALDGKRVLRMGDIIFDNAHRSLKGKAGVRHLSPTVANLLQCLWNARGTVVTKDTLKWQGWGELAVSDSALDRKIHELRSVLQEASGELELKNAYGEGFSLQTGKPKTKDKAMSQTKPSKSKAAGASELMDTAKLQSLRDLGDGDPAFFQELAEMFLNDAPPVFQRIEAALAAKDAEKLWTSAHKLKGMCFNIGATTLAECCEQLEIAGKAKRLGAAPELLERYRAEFQKVRAYLQTETKLAA